MFGPNFATTSVVAVILMATGAAPGVFVASTPQATIQAAARTHPSPSHFTHGRVDNRWFPLRPGNRLVYRGSEDGNRLRDVFLSTYKTKVIDGVICRVVHDKVFQNAILNERTTDWYAQTKHGTVWYFGERTALLDRQGHVVSREGSFQSGRDGAEAGVFMFAHPKVGQTAKQESYPGHAEDRFTVVDRNAHISVPAIGSNNALLTKETTVLEPGVLDHKYYLRDIGTVREVTVKGGNESLKLVSVSHVPR
jgi:hypothetical protein